MKRTKWRTDFVHNQQLFKMLIDFEYLSTKKCHVYHFVQNQPPQSPTSYVPVYYTHQQEKKNKWRLNVPGTIGMKSTEEDLADGPGDNFQL